MSLKKLSGYSRNEILTLEEYLERAKSDPGCYATAPERMVKAIGEPTIVDTSTDPRLSRIFSNQTIKTYPTFSNEFFGLEETIERLVNFFKFAAQGLEERKQICYLLGPVGTAKSSLVEKLKSLMEKEPIYVLSVKKNGELIHSPIYENPLGLLKAEAEHYSSEYNIPIRYFSHIPSPWAVKRLQELEGDISQFYVCKMHPSILKQIAIAKVDPGDENNQDTSVLVGKTDIRKLEYFSQNDPDAYSYCGGLCKGSQGIVDLCELFKSPKALQLPLLTATQDSAVQLLDNVGASPFSGIIVAHSNLTEFAAFKADQKNEALLDRIQVINVPYCLRVTEEKQIYVKMIKASSLNDCICAPETLELLSRFAVLTRLKEHENSTLYSKMEVYDGKNLVKETDVKAKSLQEYKDAVGVGIEGMSGISTRFAFKVLSQTFNFDPSEPMPAADPVHLFYVLQQSIKREQFPKELENKYIGFIKEFLEAKYAEFLQKELIRCFIQSYENFSQSIFDNYLNYVDFWLQNTEYRDPNTGNMYNREQLNQEFERIEKAGGIGGNVKEWRADIFNYVLRKRAKGEVVRWDSYRKMAEVIEKQVSNTAENMLPVISFNKKQNQEMETKHQEFVERMVARGYTEKTVRRLVDWHQRWKKSS